MHETSREALRTKKRVASFIERRTGQLSKIHHGRYRPLTILEIKIFLLFFKHQHKTGHISRVHPELSGELVCDTNVRVSRGHHGEGCDMCCHAQPAAGAELPGPAAVGQHSASLGMRQRTSIAAVRPATDANPLKYQSTLCYCC